jgi:endonuclease YncB( thermonuclease family)
VHLALLLAAVLQAQSLNAVLPALPRLEVVGAPGPQPGETFSGSVSAVLDADTLLIAHNGQDLQVRLEAVDSPEVAHPEHGKEGQPYGDEAAAFVRELCAGKKVQVRVAQYDRYGRAIGWITLSDGRSLQAELLREGWAWWNFFFNHDEELNKLENEAIKAGRGLWAGKTRGGVFHPEAPWVFRRRIDAGVKRVLPGDKAEFKVSHMPDADTAALGTRQGVYDYVRLAGIDAPEVSHGRSKPAQPYGVEAGARATELVEAEGKTLQVEIEDVDPYGRIVGWVKLKSRGATLNEVLLEEGLAWWYERYYPHMPELGKKQQKAKDARRGLWADPNPVPPWDYRRGNRS